MYTMNNTNRLYFIVSMIIHIRASLVVVMLVITLVSIIFT